MENTKGHGKSWKVPDNDDNHRGIFTIAVRNLVRIMSEGAQEQRMKSCWTDCCEICVNICVNTPVLLSSLTVV